MKILIRVIKCLLVVASGFFIPAVYAETVAGYRSDFSTEAMPGNWLYLWNENGSITNEANFVLLEVDVLQTNEWQTDGTIPGRPDPGQGGHLRLSALGVCSGRTDPDAYAVAGYQIQTPGRYFLHDTLLELNSTNSSGVELRVFINSETPLRVDSITNTVPVAFDTDLGLLKAGDTLYVALGPGTDPINDYCRWDFSISRNSSTPDPAEVSVNTFQPLENLDIFNSGQPVCFSFRDDYLSGKGYSVFSNTISQSYGHAPKMFAEERVASADNQPLMVQYAEDRPEKMLLCHYNLKQIKIMQYEEFSDFFPGHWIYYPGSTLVDAVSAADTVLTVVSASNILAQDPVGVTNNSVIALIPLDETGERLWEQTEYAAVVSKSGNVLTVERGLFRTAAINHTVGTYVAVLPDLYAGDADTSMRFNWSVDCPLDSQGRNCGDVFVSMMATYFSSNGPLERIHGILSDVLFWEIGDPVPEASQLIRRFDTNGDGLGDNGYDSNGFNRFALGTYDMVRKLRLALGPDRIISADGNGEQWPRLPHLFNGMESEGLSHWNDPFATDWSSNPNLFRYWNAHLGFDQSLNYIVDKLPTLTEEQLANHQLHLQRLAGAVASILDIGVKASGTATVFPDRRYELYDHLKQGVVNRLGWLGEPDEWMRPATNTPNLFSGTAGDWISADATVTQDSGEGAWRIEATGDSNDPSSDSMTIRFQGLEIPTGDLFFRFLMKADPLALFPSNVYRYVTVTVDGRQISTNTMDELTGVASSAGYTECCFYYREAGPAAVDINLTFEGPQDVWVKDFSVHNAADVFARGFENGVVLANPKNESYTFDLSELFPDRICWRLTGNTWEDPVTNNGDPVGDPVTVPALDGLFLRSEPDTDYDGLSDRWELTHAANLTVLNGSGDSDGDGVSDGDEYIAGTDPLSVESVFEISLSTAPSVLQWSAVQDHQYTIWWSDNLEDWYLYDSINYFDGDGDLQIPLSDTNSSPHGFFRMETSSF